MTTTLKFQIKPNFFSSEKECKEFERKKENTNPRYKNFCQTHFTAGDVDQFETFKDPTNGEDETLSIENNIFQNQITLPEFEKYHNLTALSVSNSFAYMFHKFKKGIFIKIKNNVLSVFLPFSKKNYVNEWNKRIVVPENFFSELEKVYKSETKLYFSTSSINKFTDCWYANNFLLRYEFPIHEGDTNNPIFADFFEVLCKERKLPNIEFFLNRRDMPLLKKDGTEPYNHIFDSETQPLLSHNYSEYAPIFSMVGSDKFADIPIPTGDDWSRVCRKEGKFFIDTCNRSFELPENIPWNERISTAVFRGSATGAGITVETNPRLKAAYLSTLKKEKNGVLLLDAGITDWNLRARKLSGNPALQTINIKNLPFSLSSKLTPAEQMKYKYIVNIPGHTAAYRLSLEMFFESCILLVESEYKLWFSHLLKPFVHYVPVKTNLEDLFEKITWCIENDEKARKIAKNAKKFAEKYLTKDGMLDYMQQLLVSLKEKTGNYTYPKSFSKVQEKQEKSLLSKIKLPKKQGVPQSFFIEERKYYFLHAVEWLITSSLSQENINFVEEKKLYENKNSSIVKSSICSFPIAIKTQKTNIVHEAFVSLKCMNLIMQKIPNFIYAFGTNFEKLYFEYIEGETLFSFLNSSSFTFENYIFILIQISLALQVAQNFCGFVHNDLTPWNIILQKQETPIEINYVIGEKVFTVVSDMIPIIIDMNRSHVIHNNIHYGTINMFSASSIQDIITLLVTSLSEVVKKDHQNPRDIVNLANFISGTKYKPTPFLNTGKGGLGDLRFFLNTAKKFENLVETNKFELENKNPLHFVNYILQNFRVKFPVKITSIYEMKNSSFLFEGSSTQVYNFALAKTDEEKLASFTDFFSSIKPKKESDPFLAYYSMQKHYCILKTVRDQLRYFDSEYKIDWFSKVKKTLLSSLENDIHEYEFPKIETLEFSFNEKDFFNKEKILKLKESLKSYKLIDLETIENYKEIATFVFLYKGKYELPEKLVNVYKKIFSQILKINEYTIKVFNANVKTLKIYSKLI